MVRPSSWTTCCTCSAISGGNEKGDDLSVPGHIVSTSVVLTGHTLIMIEPARCRQVPLAWDVIRFATEGSASPRQRSRRHCGCGEGCYNMGDARNSPLGGRA